MHPAAEKARPVSGHQGWMALLSCAGWTDIRVGHLFGGLDCWSTVAHLSPRSVQSCCAALASSPCLRGFAFSTAQAFQTDDCPHRMGLDAARRAGRSHLLLRKGTRGQSDVLLQLRPPPAFPLHRRRRIPRRGSGRRPRLISLSLCACLGRLRLRPGRVRLRHRCLCRRYRRLRLHSRRLRLCPCPRRLDVRGSEVTAHVARAELRLVGQRRQRRVPRLERALPPLPLLQPPPPAAPPQGSAAPPAPPRAPPEAPRHARSPRSAGAPPRHAPPPPRARPPAAATQRRIALPAVAVTPPRADASRVETLGAPPLRRMPDHSPPHAAELPAPPPPPWPVPQPPPPLARAPPQTPAPRAPPPPRPLAPIPRAPWSVPQPPPQSPFFCWPALPLAPPPLPPPPDSARQAERQLHPPHPPQPPTAKTTPFPAPSPLLQPPPARLLFAPSRVWRGRWRAQPVAPRRPPLAASP
eukprot:scaffold12705_cov106-Isochrysis_galbana.AAC.3